MKLRFHILKNSILFVVVVSPLRIIIFGKKGMFRKVDDQKNGI